MYCFVLQISRGHQLDGNNDSSSDDDDDDDDNDKDDDDDDDANKEEGEEEVQCLALGLFIKTRQSCPHIDLHSDCHL